jgi:hypothetical protein
MSAKTAKKGSVHQSVRTCQRQGTVGIIGARQHARSSQRINQYNLQRFLLVNIYVTLLQETTKSLKNGPVLSVYLACSIDFLTQHYYKHFEPHPCPDLV